MQRMPPSATPEQAREAFDARLAGATFAEIATELNFSVEGTRKLIAREAERQLVALQSKLLELGSVEMPIPAGEQLEAALAHVHWAVGALGDRGYFVRPYVIARHDGLVIGLQECNPEEGL